MRVPLSWLRDYVDIDGPAQELAHRLTMAGVEVGEVIELGGWKECLVGQVLTVAPHPNADNLSLCRVSSGDGEMEVVCGAPNVAAGQKVCFARVGANLYNTHSGKQETLKAARIRGVVSEGMICSEVELGLGDGHEGIVVLPEDAPVGMELDQYLGDTILDLELTPNRLDCLSMLGVAHEVAAHTGQTVREPQLDYSEEGPPIAELASISVADPDLCGRYTVSIIQGISIGPSPQWLQDRLNRAGLRPINNVVDITNYVMLEFNQPLHAFDLDKVEEQTIIVRRARPGETLETLDGVTRQLNPEVLVIADANQPVGLGGVIGGANSEIDSGTRRVLLESATFNGYNNRQTADTLRLRTEATLRFEKGLRAELAPLGLRRATQLIHDLAGGKVAQGIVDIYADRDKPPLAVSLTLKRLRQILGMDLDLPRVEKVLQSLGFRTERQGSGGFQTEQEGSGTLNVQIPYWRNDINIEEDLVEEVVRIIGYDNVPTTMLSTPIPFHQPRPLTELKERVRDTLASAGMQETISYPLISLADLERINQLDQKHPPLGVANPLSVGQEYLRPTLRASLLATLAYNQGHSEGPFRFFETARVFIPTGNGLPEEREVAAGVLAGPRWEPSWLEDEDDLSFFDAKGIIVAALERLGVNASFEPWEDATYQPGRCARIRLNDQTLGLLGQIDDSVRERFDLGEQPTALFELYLDQILEAPKRSKRTLRPGRAAYRSL
jgi:phenylalanyl-tRNA synthetase beta chain